MTLPLPAQVAFDMQAPLAGATAPLDVQRLANTGATGAENSTALTVNQYASLIVAGVAVRARWGAASSIEADTTDMVLGPYSRFDWLVTTNTKHVSIQAADGSSAYEAHVWTSSGQR